MRIAEILKDLGISPEKTGYHYLVYTIQKVVEDSSLMRAVTTRLYPMVADRFNTRWERVERCIRYAIEEGWIKGNLKQQQKLFGYTVSMDRGSPTNSQFIATVVDWLVMTEDGEIDG